MLMELLFTRQQGSGVLMVCALSAIPQGLLMWIGMSTIVSRSADPTRVMAILATSATLAQLVVSGALISMILPKFGVNGGFVTAAVVGAVGFLAAMSIPNQLVMHGPRDGERRSSGSPPARGWAALVVVALVNAAGIAILVYILPLALAGGLPKASAEGAFTALLAGQVIGGALAIMASKRSHYAPVCAGAALVLAVVWSIYGIGASVPIFLAASAVFGITFAFTLPFLMPLAIAADPSRRAAAQYGGASLLGSAVGPLVSSRVVAMFGVHGAIYAGGALLAVAVIVGAFLHFTASAPAVNTGAVEA